MGSIPMGIGVIPIPILVDSRSQSHSHVLFNFCPIPMGLPWDSHFHCDSQSYAHLYTTPQTRQRRYTALWMFVLKNRNDRPRAEWSELECKTHSKQLLKTIHPVMLASFYSLTKTEDSYSDNTEKTRRTRMWANAQRDGRPAEYRWHPVFNAAKIGWRPLLECRAVTLPRRETRWNLQGCHKLANGSQPLVGWSSPYYEDMWRRYCCLTSFFRLSIHALVLKR